jgi:hypothetical protein
VSDEVPMAVTQSTDLGIKLRGHAEAMRAGAIGPEDHGWISASLMRLAAEVDGIPAATLRGLREKKLVAVPRHLSGWVIDAWREAFSRGDIVGPVSAWATLRDAMLREAAFAAPMEAPRDE